MEELSSGILVKYMFLSSDAQMNLILCVFVVLNNILNTLVRWDKMSLFIRGPKC